MKVTIYSTPTCPACNMVKKFLDYNKVEYEALTVGEDITPEDFYEKTQSMGVPVIYVDEEKMVGFDATKLSSLLNIGN